MPDSLELIHQDLAEEVSWGIPSLYNTWAEHRQIDPFIIIWPSRTINFKGQLVNDSIPIQLPDERAERSRAISAAVKETTAWALMLCEQRAEAVVVIFESPMGTKSWHLPLSKHGDVLTLGEPRERVNTDYIGVLWRPVTAGADREGSRYP